MLAKGPPVNVSEPISTEKSNYVLLMHSKSIRHQDKGDKCRTTVMKIIYMMVRKTKDIQCFEGLPLTTSHKHHFLTWECWARQFPAGSGEGCAARRTPAARVGRGFGSSAEPFPCCRSRRTTSYCACDSGTSRGVPRASYGSRALSLRRARCQSSCSSRCVPRSPHCPQTTWCHKGFLPIKHLLGWTQMRTRERKNDSSYWDDSRSDRARIATGSSRTPTDICQ